MKQLLLLICLVGFIYCTPTLQSDELECEACEFLIEVVEGYLEENKTVIELQKLVTDVCSYLQVDLKQFCDAFADEIPKIIDLIKKDFPPTVICKEVGFCAKNRR